MKRRTDEETKTRRHLAAVHSLLLSSSAVFLTLCLFLSSSLLATTLKRLSLEEMARASNRIVQAKCVSLESRMEGGRIFTLATFEVTETLAGEETRAPTQEGKRTVIVRQLGGRVGNLHAVVPGAPALLEGEEAILFLQRDPNTSDAFMVVGLSQGHMRILKQPTTGRRVVQQSTSGADVYDPQTRKISPGTTRLVPLEDFKRALQRALERVRLQGR
jgi:hypothetical protein